MKKIYVLTDNWSEGLILGCFSSKTDAEKYIEYFKDQKREDVSIEEHFLDDCCQGLNKGFNFYLVKISEDGEIEINPRYYFPYLTNNVSFEFYELPPRMWMEIWAENEEQAIQFAKNKRLEFLKLDLPWGESVYRKRTEEE
jgi:hypothetical protein